MVIRRSFLTQAIAAGGMALVRSAHARSADEAALVIADPRGDHGLLAPYAHAADGFGYVFTSYVFDSLVGQGPQGQATAALARNWRPTANGMGWQLELDPGARWHDGRPLTAEDVVFTLEYMRRHPYAFASVDAVASARATGQSGLRLTLARRDAGFVRSVLMTMPVLPRHIYAGQQAPLQFDAPQAATGSGPYRLASHDRSEGRYVLERNRHYHLGRPRHARIVIARMAPEAALEAMRRGEVDMLTDLPIELLARARQAGLKVLTSAGGNPERLVFNHQGLLAARATRQGLAHAIDRQALVDATQPPGGARVAASGYFQQGAPWFGRQRAQEYVPDAARAASLLQAAGWRRDERGRWWRGDVLVTLRLIAEAHSRKMALALAEQLQNFGLNLDVMVLEPASLRQTIASNEYELLLQPARTMGDPAGIATRVMGQAWTADRYPDPGGAMRSLLDAQAAARDTAERRRLLAEFSALYAEQLPALMLCVPLLATAHGPRITPRFLPDGVGPGIPMPLPRYLLIA